MEEAISKWLKSVKNPKTRENYSIAMETFQQFTGLTDEEFLAEIDAEEAKPLTKRGSIEKRFVPFFEWFTAKGHAEGTAVAKIGAVMSFYRFYNYRCNFSPGKTFKAAKKNREVNITKEDVKKLISAAKNLRDRAIILVLYQSGMDLSTLRSLKVRDVQLGLESGELPLRLNLRRKKEAVEYHSFISTDAIEAVRAYLNERMRKEGALAPESPLFVKFCERKKKGHPKTGNLSLTNLLVEKFFREIAVEAKLVSAEEIRSNNWNPIRAHALRRAFGDALRAAGADFGAVEYFIGHKTPMGGAYLGNIDQAYIKVMDNLSIYGSSNEVTNLKIQAVEEQLRTSKETSAKQEEELISLRRQMEGVKELLSFIEPFIKEHLEWTAPSAGFTEKEKQVILTRQKKRLGS